MSQAGLVLELGSDSAEPGGRIPRDHGVLVLAGHDLPSGIERAFAIVDADEPLARQIHESLAAALGRKAPLDGPVSGQEEAYVSRVLQHAVPAVDRPETMTGLALTIWIGREIVIGCIRSPVYHCQSHMSLNGVPSRLPVLERLDGRIVRRTVSPGDSLLLASSTVVGEIREDEIQQTVCGEFSRDFTVQDAAVWLASVASLRSGRAATALVAQFHGHRKGTGILPLPLHIGRKRR